MLLIFTIAGWFYSHQDLFVVLFCLDEWVDFQGKQLCHFYFASIFIKGQLWRKEYRKNSKNWDTLNYYRDCPTNVIVGFYSAILRSKDADRITNRVDTDQTAPWGAVWSGYALFAQTYLSQYFKLLRYDHLNFNP